VNHSPKPKVDDHSRSRDLQLSHYLKAFLPSVTSRRAVTEKNAVFWDVTAFFIVTAVKTSNLTTVSENQKER
jgi:hypothetical protein